MTVLREKDGIRYTLVDEKDLDQVTQLVALVFTDGSEPVTRELNVRPDDFARFVRSFFPKFLREGLSIVARDAVTGEVVGAQLNDDMGTELPDPDGLYEWAEPVMGLLGELDGRYFGDRVVEPRQYAHLFLVAVSPLYRRKRISPQLLELSLAVAAGKGYKKATAEATGLISQHVLRKAGFEPRVEIPYAKFEYNGYRPFQGIKDHPSAVLMDRELKC